MLISCEKCSTTYVLDDALIPPQGAPVQCTRCGHVFTAKVAAPEPAAAQRAPNTTMMFGAGSVPQPPAAANPRSTMVFGAGSAPAAPAKNTTMMFGTSASNAAPAPSQPAPSARSTMVFGAGAAPAPQPAKNSTMVFGAGAAPAPQPAKNSTMVFGAASAPPPAKNTTMMFGAQQGASSPPPPAAPAPPANRNTTMMFGVQAPPAPEAAPSRDDANRTLMFGKSVAPAAAAPDAAAAKNTTMMFGRAPAIPKVTAGAAEAAGYAADEEAPNELTLRVDVDEMSDEQRNDSGDRIEAPAPHDRTQRYAMTDATTPESGKPSVQDRHNRTQLFAMHEATVPDGSSADEPQDLNATLPFKPKPGASSDVSRTLPPDAHVSAVSDDPVSTLYDPAVGEPGQGPDDEPQPVATTLPDLGDGLHGAPALAPLALETPLHGHEVVTQPTPAVNAEDLAAIRAARSGGAGRVVVIVLALVAIVLAAILIYRLFPGLFGAEAPRVGSASQVVQARVV